MVNKEQIMQEATYYIENDDVTVEEAAKHFNISKRTFQLHMAKLLDIAPDIARLQREKSQRMQEMRRGNYERTAENARKPNWTSEDAVKIAQYMIENNATIRMAGEHFQIPKTTIHEMISKGISNDSPIRESLDELIDAHNKDKSQNNYLITDSGPKK